MHFSEQFLLLTRFGVRFGSGCPTVIQQEFVAELGIFRNLLVFGRGKRYCCFLVSEGCQVVWIDLRWSGAKREVGFGKEDQDLVSASATAKHASCCRCAKRR
jgi:hypothetical protein